MIATVPHHLMGVAAAVSPNGLKMKVTRCEAIPVRVPFHPRVRQGLLECYRKERQVRDHYAGTIVRLYTDAGLVGTAEAGADVAATRGLFKRIVGRSPWEFAFDDGLGGVLIGLYDLMGQSANVPVARLFSPRPSGRIHSAWWSHCFRPELLRAEAKIAVESGYRAHKVEARPWETPRDQAAALSEVIPGNYRVWFDADGGWVSVGRTRYLTGQLQDYPFVFALESVIPSVNRAAYRQLRGQSAVRLADRVEGLQAFRLIQESVLDTFVLAGDQFGRTLADNVSLAEYFGIRVWLQNPLATGISQVFLAHQAAAFPAVELTVGVTNILEDDLIREPFVMSDGLYPLPRRAGLGVTVDEHALDKYRVG